MFTPEWAHAADGEDSRRIYEALYSHLAASWVEDGYSTHLISVLADDPDAMRVWHWFGFGMIAADAVRGVNPLGDPVREELVRRAGPGDVEHAAALSDALQDYMGMAPTFFAHDAQRGRQGVEAFLGNPAYAFWLAFEGGEAVAYMLQGPASEEACTILRDEKTTSIVGAYTREDMRGSGVATALLNRALAWARDAGYARCAVDFEPMNPLATRFWLKHFQPACYTLVRQVDLG